MRRNIVLWVILIYFLFIKVFSVVSDFISLYFQYMNLSSRDVVASNVFYIFLFLLKEKVPETVFSNS